MKTLLIFLFSISSVAFADFGGEWGGTGTLTRPNGEVKNCQMQFHFEQAASSFTVVSGNLDCEGDQQQWSPNVYTVQGTDLFYKQTHIGTLTDKELKIQLSDGASSSIQYNLKLTAENTIEYSDEMNLRSGKYSTVGVLTKN